MEIAKGGFIIRVSDELLYPKRGHSERIPMSDERRHNYERVVEEWRAALNRWKEVRNYAIGEGFAVEAFDEYGGDEGQYSLLPLREKTKWVWDETDEEYKERVSSLRA